MTRIALAAAEQLADAVDAWGMPGLRALLPIAGMSVVEHQAEQARAMGCDTLLLLIDALPAALTEAIDRIRARGLPVQLVRNASDVMAACEGARELWLIADGLVAAPRLWRAAGLGEAPLLLTVEDGPVTATLERIDAQTRWAGLARLTPAEWADLGNAPADWDAQLYLLRGAIQSGVAQYACEPSMFVGGDATLADSLEDAADAQQKLLTTSSRVETGLVGRFVVAPMLALAAPALLARQSSGNVALLTSHLGGIAAIAGALTGHIGVAAVAGLVAAIGHQAADFVRRFRPVSRVQRGFGWLGLMLQFVALGVAERGMTVSGGQWHMGSGSNAICLFLALTLLLQRRIAQRLAQWGPDFLLAWLVSAVSVVAFGWRGGFDLAAGLVGLTLVIPILWGVVRDDVATSHAV